MFSQNMVSGGVVHAYNISVYCTCGRCVNYDLRNRSVSVSKRKVILRRWYIGRFRTEDKRYVAHMLEYTSMGLPEVIHSVTKMPAQKLGIQKGELKKGYAADIAIFDENFSIICTVVAGKRKYSQSI